MSRKHIEWLFEQLPTLVEEGVLTSDAAAHLRAHYESRMGDKPNWALLSFAVLGGILIGSGIILVLAHNWEGLSRPMRTVLSMLPMITAQALAAWVILRRNESVAWRGGGAADWRASIGGGIALVAPTYNLGGTI